MVSLEGKGLVLGSNPRDSICNLLQPRVNVGVIDIGHDVDNSGKRILHALIFCIGGIEVREKARVHHPAVYAAGDGERRRAAIAFERDARRIGIVLVTHNASTLRTGTTQREAIFK